MKRDILIIVLTPLLYVGAGIIFVLMNIVALGWYCWLMSKGLVRKLHAAN